MRNHHRRHRLASLVMVLAAALTLVFDAPGLLTMSHLFAPEAQARGGGGGRGGGGFGGGGGGPRGGGFGAPPG
ncbi:hypothetical protein, partial [Solidesulfovibrio aerotolerans]|uniref:hypothetical protein n=1 Tax=Solidesulfovibrio aerotolerans TaxID=295255 RepID=UPI001BA998D0